MRRDNIWRKSMYPKLKGGWTGVGDIPGHAADVRDFIEKGAWGGCSHPVGTDGQHG
jgi:hypothetical protein